MTRSALALTAILLFVPGDPDKTKVTLDLQNTSVKELLDHITRISGVPIELDDAALKKLGDPAKERISVKVQDISVTGALQLLFTPRGLEVKVIDRKQILVTAP